MNAEQHASPCLSSPVARLLELLQTDRPRLLVALGGLPGAGKSTLVARWTQDVNAQTRLGTMIALGMDGFHLTKEQLRQLPNAEEAFARRGAPWTFDPLALAARLQQLRAASGRESVAWPDFQHEQGDPVEGALLVPPDARLVLVEGLYLLHREGDWAAVSNAFDERWFLDTPFEVAMHRLTERHIREWKWTREAAEQRVASNDRLNAEIVLASRRFADFLVV